jgi:hypothetical protein
MRFLVLSYTALFSSALLAAQTPAPPAPAAELKRQLDQQAPAWLQEFHVTSASKPSLCFSPHENPESSSSLAAPT